MPTVVQPILPGATIGVLGSGQLGRMLALAAAPLGYRVAVYSPQAGSPAGQVAEREVVGDYEDTAAIAAFAATVDVLTFEFENISGAATAAAAERVPVRPSPHVLEVAQRRGTEKRFLTDAGFPVAPWASLDSAADLDTALQRVGLPAIVKTAGYGYDGKGQRRVASADEAAAALAAFAGQPAVVEQVIEFDRELSVIGARGAGGGYADWGVFENRHHRHILDVTSTPAAAEPKVIDRARELARDILETLEVVGLTCVELFQRGDDLLVNELAPRPHNSGHLTIDACVTSQFEQHVRAVCGLPLGSTRLLAPAAMANLLGDLWNPLPDWTALLADANVKLHLYGKQQARAGRKMGHMTALADSAAAAIQRVTSARARLAAPVTAAAGSG